VIRLGATGSKMKAKMNRGQAQQKKKNDIAFRGGIAHRT